MMRLPGGRAGDSSIEEEEEKETMPCQLTQGCWLPHLAPLPTTISVAEELDQLRSFGVLSLIHLFIFQFKNFVNNQLLMFPKRMSTTTTILSCDNI